MIRRSGGWLCATVGDDLMMMSLEGGYVGINRIGARIWEMIETPVALDQVCDRLIAEFDVDSDTCRRQVQAFVAQMERLGAIVVEPA